MAPPRPRPGAADGGGRRGRSRAWRRRAAGTEAWEEYACRPVPARANRDHPPPLEDHGWPARRASSRHVTVTAETPEPRDASEVGATATREAWSEAARTKLLEAAGSYRALVTYKQLATAVQEISGITTTQPMHQWIGDVLGRVTDECQSRGEPLLSSLCVSVQGSVGQGYADAVEKARGTRPTDPDEQ